MTLTPQRPSFSLLRTQTNACATTAAATPLVGCGSLLLCATVTTTCSIVAELYEMEPSLRGLVHAGVMILFAGICVEPVVVRSSVTHTAMTDGIHDAQGIGIVFAGLGLALLSATFMIWLVVDILNSTSTTTQLLESTIRWTLLLLAVLILLVSFKYLIVPVLRKSASTTATTSEETCLHVKSLATFGLFLLACFASLYDTVSVEYATYFKNMESDTGALMILILNAMAYVFHRAFIGSLLTGGGFGVSSRNDSRIINATTDVTTDSHEEQLQHHQQQEQRLDLRCRYRAYFCIVCLNLGVSWILCSSMTSSLAGFGSGLGMIFAGMLQIDELLSFGHRQFNNRAWTWDCFQKHLRPSLWINRQKSVELTSESTDFSPDTQPQFLGQGYCCCVAAFSFYSCTLFADDVVLLEDDENKGNGFDGCLTRAVHVAAVLAAMLAIFPRLLLRSDTDESSSQKIRNVHLHNAVVKGVVALMSTVDIFICFWIIASLGSKESAASAYEYDDGDSKKRKIRITILYLRIVGAALQAATFAVLQVKATNNASVELSKAENKSSSAMKEDIPLVESSFKNNCSSNHGTTNNGETGSFLNNRSNDGVSVTIWLAYFCAHALHSCVSPSYHHNVHNSAAISAHTPVAEIQLSKIFHFQVITLGFYTTSVFRRDAISCIVVSVFAALEIAGILACQQSDEEQSVDIIAILIASFLLLGDSLRQRLIQQHGANWSAVAQLKKEAGAGAVLFPS